MLFHSVYDPATPTLVKVLPPLPEQGIEFLPKGLATAGNQQTAAFTKEMPYTLFGQPVSRMNYGLPTEDYLVIRVIFQPGGLFRLLGGLPLTEFTDKLLDAEPVLSGNKLSINEQLLEANTYAQLIDIVDSYLRAKIRQVKTDIHAVDKIGQLLLHTPGRFSLDWLATQACLSPRQLERKFVERMGIGPKLYSRISRFHQAFVWKEANPQVDWLTVAVNFGYTDFHHLYKDVKEFAGVTPNTLLTQYAYSPDKFVQDGPKRRFSTNIHPG